MITGLAWGKASGKRGRSFGSGWGGRARVGGARVPVGEEDVRRGSPNI